MSMPPIEDRVLLAGAGSSAGALSYRSAGEALEARAVRRRSHTMYDKARLSPRDALDGGSALSGTVGD